MILAVLHNLYHFLDDSGDQDTIEILVNIVFLIFIPTMGHMRALLTFYGSHVVVAAAMLPSVVPGE